MPIGTTGGFVWQDFSGRKKILETVIEHAHGIPAIANISDTRLATVRELGKAAKQLGYSGIALLPPWYFRLPDEDIVEFIVRGAESAELPLMLYNFPERTGVKLTASMISAIARKVPVFGIKQSGSDFEYHRELVALGRVEHFCVFTGNDPRLNEAISMGASGNVGGMSNFVPEWITELHRAATLGLHEESNRLTHLLTETEAICLRAPSPFSMGAGVHARGFDSGLPPEFLSTERRTKFLEVTESLGEFFQRNGLPNVGTNH